MARRATRDTYALQQMGPGEGSQVRRLVKAGSLIPATYEMEEGTYEEVQDPGAHQTVFGHVTPPPDHLVESRTTRTFGNTSLSDTPGMDQPGENGGDDASLSGDDIDSLQGDELDAAVSAAGIDATTGGSRSDGSLSADEKRDALREHHGA
jgi:hypothetical protein